MHRPVRRKRDTMLTPHIGTLRTARCVLIFSLLALASCAQSPAPITNAPTRTAVSSPTQALASPTITVPPIPSPTPSPTSTKTAPARYTAHPLLRGVGRPDDLAFDPQGRLLFSDEFDGTISRLNADYSVTLLLTDSAGPEGSPRAAWRTEQRIMQTRRGRHRV